MTDALLHAALTRAGNRTLLGKPLPYDYDHARERLTSLVATALVVLASAGTVGWTQLASL